jgi:hypothetical protein
MGQQRKKGGRPRGVNYPVAVRAYENDEGMRLMTALAEIKGGLSTAALLRQLVREEAARQGLTQPSRWAVAAERLRGYYSSSPEVREWLDADEGYLDPEAPTEEQGLLATGQVGWGSG